MSKEDSIEIFRWFALALLVFGGIAMYFYTVVFTSVWCFFSAIISSMLYLYIREENNSTKL